MIGAQAFLSSMPLQGISRAELFSASRAVLEQAQKDAILRQAQQTITTALNTRAGVKGAAAPELVVGCIRLSLVVCAT